MANGPAGAKLLNFPYGDGYPQTVEQRFALNADYPDLWMAFDLYIPENFEQIDREPESLNEYGGSSKLVVLFSDDYSNLHPTLILGFSFKRGSPNINTVYQNGNMSWANEAGEREYFGVPDAAWDSVEPLIDADKDIGTTMRIIVRLKMASTVSSNDGICGVWLQKANGEQYQIADIQNGPWYGANPASTGGNYMNGGYLLGSTNYGFDEDTTLKVGDVVYSTTSLLDEEPEPPAEGDSRAVARRVERPLFRRVDR